MRRFLTAALATLCAGGAALAATAAPAGAATAAPATTACAGTIQIASMTWNPAQVQPGQGSTLTVVAQNCTAQPQQASLMFVARFLGSADGIPPGCPVIDPLPPATVTIAAGATYTATQGYSTFAGCTADRLEVTATFSSGGTVLARGVTDLPIGTATPACAVKYTVTSEWAGGFVAQITIGNLAATPANGWTLVFTYPGDQVVTGAWNAMVTQSGATVTARSLSYNGAIASGGTTSFGVQGTWHTSDAPPTAFTLNGAPCRVQ